jgi:O-6-methylguanine DNA methyltransferase
MNAVVAYAQMDSPIGPLWIAATATGICAVGLGAGQPQVFLAWLTRHISKEPPREDPEALASALTQLREYFSRIRQQFDLPLDTYGTAFQKAVWTEVASVPYGAMTTYGEIAQRTGRPRAARAVGAALGANPLPLLIPCHRVIGAEGSLIGYRGGVEMKAALLRLEGALLH